MLIMNQNHDALVDTTGAVIRIDDFEDVQIPRYRVCGYVRGMRVTISEHEDLEEAKKVVDVIHLAAGVGLKAWDFNGDMTNLDNALKNLRALVSKSTFKLMRGE